MNRLRQILKDRRGVAFPLIIAIVLVLVMLMCCISEYFRLLIVAQGVRDAVQEAVISTVNDNYDDVYHGVREGYSGAYQPLAGDFEESLDYGDIYGRLDDILGLTYRGGYHTQYTEDGGMEFRVWGLDVEIRNAPFASGDSAGDRFVADCEIELEVPVSFGGELLPPMRMTVKVSAGYQGIPWGPRNLCPVPPSGGTGRTVGHDCPSESRGTAHHHPGFGGTAGAAGTGHVPDRAAPAPDDREHHRLYG